MNHLRKNVIKIFKSFHHECIWRPLLFDKSCLRSRVESRRSFRVKADDPEMDQSRRSMGQSRRSFIKADDPRWKWTILRLKADDRIWSFWSAKADDLEGWEQTIHLFRMVTHRDSLWLMVTHHDSWWPFMTDCDWWWLIMTSWDLWWLLKTYFDSWWLNNLEGWMQTILTLTLFTSQPE